MSVLMSSSAFIACCTTCFQTRVESASLHSLRWRDDMTQLGALHT